MATDKRQTMGTFCSYIKILHVHERKRKLYNLLQLKIKHKTVILTEEITETYKK
jgi:hypothetical protein